MILFYHSGKRVRCTVPFVVIFRNELVPVVAVASAARRDPTVRKIVALTFRVKCSSFRGYLFPPRPT